MNHMNEILGVLSLILVIFFTYLLTLKFPNISNILVIALVLRILLLLVGEFLIMLPDSDADAEDFETGGWILAQGGFSYVWNYLDGPDPQAFVWLIAILYSLLDRSIIMIQSLSILFGIGTVFLSWLISNKLWDKSTAKKIALTVALFPSLILYSVLVMREIYMVFFILLAIYGVIEWSKEKNFKSIILAIIGFMSGAFFHGAIFVGAIAFLIIVGISALGQFIKLIINYKINLKTIIFLLIFLSGSILYFQNKVRVSYIGDFEKSRNITNLLELTRVNTRGTASWPKWTIISNPEELFYKVPIRSIYFIFAPFPWDIKQFRHLIPMLDAFLYIYLAYLIFLNRKIIWKDPALRSILIILVFYVFVFAIGVGNFGTGIRHRTKFVVLFILLAGPLLKKITFSKRALKNHRS